MAPVPSDHSKPGARPTKHFTRLTRSVCRRPWVWRWAQLHSAPISQSRKWGLITLCTPAGPGSLPHSLGAGGCHWNQPSPCLAKASFDQNTTPRDRFY